MRDLFDQPGIGVKITGDEIPEQVRQKIFRFAVDKIKEYQAGKNLSSSGKPVVDIAWLDMPRWEE